MARLAKIGAAGAVAASALWMLADRKPAAPALQTTAAAGAAVSPQQDELLLVQVVFRHGARTPLGRKYWPELKPSWDVCGSAFNAVPITVSTPSGAPQPLNPDDQRQVDLKYEGGCHKGELTLVGQLQARRLGEWLRARYVGGGGGSSSTPTGNGAGSTSGFLPSTYLPGSVNAQTTNYSRTIATLRGVLTGLYPDTPEPIAVTTLPEIEELLYSNVRSCARLKELVMELHAENKRRSAAPPPHIAALQATVQQALHLPDDPPVDFLDLHDALTTLFTHGKGDLVPQALHDPSVRSQIEVQATDKFMHLIAPEAETGKKEAVLRLGMGRLIKLMLERMDAAAERAASGTSASGTSPKLYLYSGHDSSIMPLLAALGKRVEQWPGYTSNIVVELWRAGADGKPYVKVLYDRQPLELQEMSGSAGHACELNRLREHVLAPFLLTKEEHLSECSVTFLHDRVGGKHMATRETNEVEVGSSFEEKEED